MMHRSLECPTCGNVVRAKGVRGPQKCDWCKRYFVVNITNGGKKWSVESVEYKRPELPKYQNTDNIREE